MIDFQAVQDFIEKTKRSTSLDELKIEFGKIIKEMGFGTFACVSYVDFGAPPEGAVTIIEYDDHFFSRYKEQHYEKHDRVLKIALQTTLPFIWTSELVQKGMTKYQKQIFSEAADVKMLQGITIPVHCRGAYPGSVNVVGDNIDINPEMVNTLHLMGIYFHEAALKMAQKDLKIRNITSELLTDRERECLRWTAVGKTDWEIGEILDLSESTIHFHVENAKHKLHVHTRVQAVVEAYFQNQILP